MTTNEANKLTAAMEAYVAAEKAIKEATGCCNMEDLKCALNACDNIRTRLDSQIRREKGVIGPITFYNFWTGENSFEFGGANPSLVSTLLVSYLKQYGIYVCHHRGEVLDDEHKVISNAFAEYIVKQPKYFPTL